jgi:hypothetical protein
MAGVADSSAAKLKSFQVPKSKVQGNSNHQIATGRVQLDFGSLDI